MRRPHILLAILSAATATAQFQWPSVRTEERGPGSETKYARNLNGQEVPVQSVTEIVIEDTASVKITERTTIKYDPNGRPGPDEKERIELHRDGPSERIIRTLTRRDTNGNSYVSEISRTSSTTVGDTTATRTEVETGNPSGRRQIAKVQETRVVRPDEFTSTQTTTVSSPDVNGRFGETARSVTEYRKARSGEVTIVFSEFAATGGAGMSLVKREVRRIAGDRAEVEVYEPSAPGRASTAEPALVRRQNIERVTANGQTVETTTVQPVGSDGKLEPPRPAERRVCNGCAP
ncbi:MAG: hypothetical protein SGI92_16200 [Bryobacteraceae bacterium]|nr:hypothetical protein [Bryobacteraceae bacterium]